MMNPVAQMRSEIKYLVPNELLEELRDTISSMMRLDKHGLEYVNKGYTVRSLYLDTPKLLYYTEKLDGLKQRKKLRIRAYNDLHPEAIVFLEIKRKIEAKVAKNRASLAFNNLNSLLHPQSSNHLPALIKGDVKSVESANKFLFHLHQNHLQATNLVVYEREAFEGKLDHSLRVTFDKNLRSKITSTHSDLYSEEDITYVLPHHFILEIKYNYNFPHWFTPILARFKLNKQALSKYVMSLEQCTGLKGHDLLLSLRSRYHRNSPVTNDMQKLIIKDNKERPQGAKEYHAE